MKPTREKCVDCGRQRATPEDLIRWWSGADIEDHCWTQIPQGDLLKPSEWTATADELRAVIIDLREALNLSFCDYGILEREAN